jgi:hypothetical protein
MNWSSYIRNYCIGIKKYLLKEALSPPSMQKSSKHIFIKAKYISYLIIHHNSNRLFSSGIRRFISILTFFAVTWIMRQMFLKRLR